MDLTLFHKYSFAFAPAEVEPHNQGFLLKENLSNRISQKASLFSKVIGFLIFGIFLFLFWWFFLIIFLIGGVIIFVINPTIIVDILASFKLLPAEIILPSYPLKLGEKSTFQFRRRLKKNRILPQAGKLYFTLSCVEKVEYTKGTDTETETHVVWESPSTSYPLYQGSNLLEMKNSLEIPSYLPPSFEGKHNQIRWVMSVHQEIPGISKNIYSHFTILVDPVIVL